MRDQPYFRNQPAILPAVLSLAAAWTLSGCSEGAGYPSLASRPAERLADAAQSPTSSPAPIPKPNGAPGMPSADLAKRLDQLVDQAQSAHRDFAGQQAATERQVSAAGAAPAGSEAWARATQALSGIEAARSLTAQPLTDLDRIEIEDHLAHAGQDGIDGNQSQRPDAIAIAQARDTVSELVTAEDAVLAKLDGRLAH